MRPRAPDAGPDGFLPVAVLDLVGNVGRGFGRGGFGRVGRHRDRIATGSGTRTQNQQIIRRLQYRENREKTRVVRDSTAQGAARWRPAAGTGPSRIRFSRTCFGVSDRSVLAPAPEPEEL